MDYGTYGLGLPEELAVREARNARLYERGLPAHVDADADNVLVMQWLARETRRSIETLVQKRRESARKDA